MFAFSNPSRYLRDSKKISINFEVYLISPGSVRATKINANGINVRLEQQATSFRFLFEKNISSKLFDDLLRKKNGTEWIHGYVVEILPYVNQEILRQRYEYAYFLLKTFAPQDILEIRLIDMKASKGIQILGPTSMGEIILDQSIAQIHNTYLFLRDLIDAMNAYINSNYEDAIRKLITSIENFVRHNDLKRKKKETKSSFIDVINQNINIYCDMHNRDAARDIIETYLLRNKIVHEGKRLNLIKGKKIFKDGLHAVLDVYKKFGNDDKIKSYADHVDLQFTAHEAFIGGLLSLSSQSE